MTPFQRVISRVQGFRPNARGGLAYCSAHDDRSRSLSVSEGAGGAVLVKCFAGCSAAAVVTGLGLAMRDLFPAKDGDADRRDDLERRRAFRRAPRETVEEFLMLDVERQRDLRISRRPFGPPYVLSCDVNAARRRVSEIFGVSLPPIARLSHEGFPPHDSDPAWPSLFARALEVEGRRWHHFNIPGAPAWETADLPVRFHPLAGDLAASWLRGMTIASEPARRRSVA